MPDRSRIVHRILIAAGLILVMVLQPSHAGRTRAQGSDALAPIKIDPALRAAAAAQAEPLPVWVSFTDKGEQGPADLALALAAARQRLSPRCLARRLRAGVQPLVDERDLPVHTPYLDALRARGFRPVRQLALAQSRGGAPRARPPRRGGRIAVRERPAPGGARHAYARALADRRRSAWPSRAARTARPRRTCSITASMPRRCSSCTFPSCTTRASTGSGVLIAMLDDGFNYHNRHEALATIDIPPGYERDFVDGDYSVSGHHRFHLLRARHAGAGLRGRQQVRALRRHRPRRHLRAGAHRGGCHRDARWR